MVCAATAPVGWSDPRVKDSKQLSQKQRSGIYAEFAHNDKFPSTVVEVSSEEIDAVGVYAALQSAHTKALRAVFAKSPGEHLAIIDGSLPVDTMGLDFPVVALPKADMLVPECSLASILAKTIQVDAMLALDKVYPEYGFSSSKGYGTPAHKAALAKYGPCPAHRKCYSPIRRALEKQKAETDLALF